MDKIKNIKIKYLHMQFIVFVLSSLVIRIFYVEIFHSKKTTDVLETYECNITSTSQVCGRPHKHILEQILFRSQHPKID